MTISAPSEPPPPPPPPEPVTRITNIHMWAYKIKGKRTVTADVWADDEYWQDAVGAKVLVDWTYPNGKTERFEVVTSSSGIASFEVRNVKTGTHSLAVFDVEYREHPLDREYGVLTSSIEVK
jgi:hypothetical protein